jgi:type III secretory pathway component EscT
MEALLPQLVPSLLPNLARPAAALLVLLWASGALSWLSWLGSLAVAAVLSLAVAWLVAPPFFLGALAAPLEPSAPLYAVELWRGAALGLGAAAPIWAARTAGGWAGQRWQIGGGPSPIAALYAALLGVAFVAVDGPVLVCAALAHSYEGAALGAPILARGFELAGVGRWLGAAVQLGLPVLAAVAVAELAMAAAARAGGAAASAWPTSAIAPALVTLLLAPMVPLLVGALIALVRRGLL